MCRRRRSCWASRRFHRSSCSRTGACPRGRPLAAAEALSAGAPHDSTYGFFSHVIKAQPHNMPLLDALVDKNVRMMDYECIVRGGQRGGTRLVAFGRYAGLAGMVDTMRGLGERLLSLGMSTCAPTPPLPPSRRACAA